MKYNNLIDVLTTFADKEVATNHLIKLRWNGKPTCPHCNGTKVYTLKGATKRFKCASCREQFSATKGTIFENSAIPLQKWFGAIYLITSHKKGISSHQLAKDLSITQKSAWFVLQRVRYALQSGSFTHSPDAILECDETVVGGSESNKHESKRLGKKIVVSHVENPETGYKKTRYRKVSPTEGKAIVFGILERGGKVKATVIRDVTGDTLMNVVSESAKEGAIVFTDEAAGYNSLHKKFFHQTVRHNSGEYVRGMVHSNGIENFWSLLQRGIVGIYHSVSDKHLNKYVDEFEFRFNSRKMSEAERFDKMLSLCNRRLTYNELIAEHEEGERTQPIQLPN